ncbi:response regulator transcription factor [Herpetosiphon giganteus]|uniref:response regulator transcription factor n=1 Tax=Herpetosiphon giganteus TaxID=2029754 RepID=UPI0019573FFB|nr:response regulator [Herpetosiphon giganteus]MBM7843396.1 CheY-like chemotaxis protein [Herpetosiphon giganteus]
MGMIKILVADDEPDVLFMTSFSLRSLGGFEVIEAHNGAEAVELALQVEPELLVLDIKMPKMTGYEACRELRKHPQFASTPIILLSAKGQKTEIDEGWESGATEYMLKPYAPATLIGRVRELLSTQA